MTYRVRVTIQIHSLSEEITDSVEINNFKEIKNFEGNAVDLATKIDSSIKEVIGLSDTNKNTS